MLNGRNILLLVGGSIAAYKAAELTREMVKRGGQVHIAMSDAAQEFITPLTLQALSGYPVVTDLFDETSEAEIGHIQMADSADVVLLAPATADTIAKLAAGIADDILSTVALATKAPIIVAPAMNVNMWQNPITQRNVETLRSFGIEVMEPGSGDLACGWEGPGRFPDVEEITEQILHTVSKKDLDGFDVIVTAGPTREMLDPIRFFSNRSSGRMGYAMAKAARRRGANVSLVSGPTTAVAKPTGIDFHQVNSAEEMRAEVMRLVEEREGVENTDRPLVIFMVAAVSDHRPANVSDTKIKGNKGNSYQLDMVPNSDILLELGEIRASKEGSNGRPFKLVGFAAETGEEEELLAWASEKLAKKKVDLMVGNFADDAFERETNRVWLIDRSGRQEELSTADKDKIAERIITAMLKA